MADNINVSAGTGTIIATDDIAGIQHQRVKIVIGADGVSNGDVSSANPIPSLITNTSLVVTGGSATGVAPSFPPVSISGIDNGGLKRSFKTDTQGRIEINAIQAMPAAKLTNPTGTSVNEPITGIDLSNTSTVNLGIGATFTGAFKDVSEYSNVSVFVFADQVSATDGLIIEFSTNGTTVVDNDNYTIPINNGQQFSLALPTQFYRVRYVNGPTATTSFVISCKLHSESPKSSSHRLSQLVSDESDAEVVKAYQQHDINRNVTTYHMTLPVVTTATDTLQSLTGFKSGAAVAATTTPAVVTTGKRYRITSIAANYISIATASAAKITLRLNTAGLVVIGSPAVDAWVIGTPAAAAGVGSSIILPLPDGLEIPAGSGLGISIVGIGATGLASASGYVQVAITGHEY